MSNEERSWLMSPHKMAEEVHPLPVKGTSSKWATQKAESRPEPGNDEGDDTSISGSPTSKRKLHCPMYFGVRSYLHHFYDKSSSYKDPSIYEDDDDLYILRTHPRSNRRCCSSIWWKIFMTIGVSLLLCGVAGILIGYLVPPKEVVVSESKTKGEWYIDKEAKKYNMILDMSKLIGLVVFCVGGLTLAMSLLFPTFSQYCRDDEDTKDDSKFPLRMPEEMKEGVRDPLSPVELSIPATSRMKSVQPSFKAPQSTLSRSSCVMYRD